MWHPCDVTGLHKRRRATSGTKMSVMIVADDASVAYTNCSYYSSTADLVGCACISTSQHRVFQVVTEPKPEVKGNLLWWSGMTKSVCHTISTEVIMSTIRYACFELNLIWPGAALLVGNLLGEPFFPIRIWSYIQEAFPVIHGRILYFRWLEIWYWALEWYVSFL